MRAINSTAKGVNDSNNDGCVGRLVLKMLNFLKSKV